MKKLLFFLSVALGTSLFAQNLYFDAYKDILKAKRLLNTDKTKADRLFVEAYGYLKQVVNSSIDENKPSSNAFKLLGEMYLNGWGVDKDMQKAKQLLCAAKNLGNTQAKRLIEKSNIQCGEINYKELKQ